MVKHCSRYFTQFVAFLLTAIFCGCRYSVLQETEEGKGTQGTRYQGQRPAIPKHCVLCTACRLALAWPSDLLLGGITVKIIVFLSWNGLGVSCHFTGGEIEAHRGEVAYPKSLRQTADLSPDAHWLFGSHGCCQVFPNPKLSVMPSGTETPCSVRFKACLSV